MKQGALIFDERSDRYDIRFDLADYYGGLHCGETFDVMVGGRWKPTRIEYGDDWYLVGIRADDLSGLRGQTLARRDMLLEQSALLRRRAEAFGAFEARLAYAQRHLDEPTLCERPLLHMLSPSLSELDFVDFKSRDSLEQFIAAMPDTRISFARKSAPGSERDFRLCANDGACAAWNLPLAHTRPLAPARCIRLIHRFACQPWDDEAMPELTAIGRKAGYAIAEDQPYLGLHLATENHQEHIYFYATFYLPVLEG